MSRPRSHPGHSMPELLVAIAIVALLLGLLLPAVQRCRAAALRMQCSSRVGQVALAFHSFHNSEGRLPKNDDPRWGVDLLPFLEQEALFRRYDPNTEPVSAANRRVIECRNPLFLCPASKEVGHPDGFGESNHPANGEVLNVETLAGVTDGMSNTALLFDRRNPLPEPGEPSLVRAWGLGPVDQTVVVESPPHPGVVVVGMVDGGTRVLRTDTSQGVLGALVSPEGGEAETPDW